MPDSRPDVAILLDHFGGGGVERVACHLANGLNERGFRVELVVLRNAGPVRDLLHDGVSVHVLKTLGKLGRRTRLLAAVPDLARYLRRRRPRLFHSPGNHTHKAAGLAVRLAQFDGVFVPKITNPILKDSMKPWNRRLRRWLYAHLFKPASSIIVLSQSAVAKIGMIHPDLTAKAIFLHNPYVTEEMAARDLVQHPVTPPVILSVGRLSPQKDHPTLLRALSLLHDRSWRLRICGDGPDKDALIELAEGLGIADRVEFVGFVHDMVPHYEQAHVMVLSSRWEDLPATLIEALACRCPVLSTASSQAVVDLLEGVGARAPLPIGDPEALAAALREALDGQLPIVGREAVSAFGIEAACEVHGSLFAELIARTREDDFAPANSPGLGRLPT